MATTAVATFNLRWGQDDDGEPYDLVDALGSLDADVIAVQEAYRGADDDAFLRAAEALGYHAVGVPLADDADPHGQRIVGAGAGTGTWGIAVLARSALGVREVVDLPRVPGDPVQRRAAVVDIDDAVATSVVVAHLTHRVPLSMLHLALVARLGRTSGSPIVAGDMNCPAWAAVAVRGRYRDAVRAVTWPARWPFVQIDHLFVDSGLRVLGGSRIRAGLSDHWALRAVLTTSS